MDQSYKDSIANYKTMTVVVIDSIDNMRTLVAKMLTEIGFKKVFAASNATEALKLIGSHKVDLIVSECALPKVSGIELLRKIRTDRKLCNIPFVMMSANIEQEEVILAIKNGVSEYIVKPFSPKILLERIARSFENPIKKSATHVAANTKTESASKSSEPFQILVVDDVSDNIQIISDILRKDYKVKAATSGEKALKICASEPQPNLVLLDIMMPEMNGMEVCKRLKANPKTQHITVIFLTSLDQTKHIVKGFELGAVDYITKPINPPVLQARVKNHQRIVENTQLMRSQIDTMIENSRLKEEFDRISQNDLKHPIEEMVKSVHILDKCYRDPKRVKQNTGSIKNSCTQLTQMVDNMLTLNKLESGCYQLSPTKVNLRDIIEHVIDVFSVSSNERSLEIHNEINKPYHSQIEELLTVSLISNLYKNAIEASPRGSSITITAEEQGDFTKLSIHNNGAIPETIKDVFFEKYITYGKRNGTGIGSYAAKLMTEAQHGKISFETSEENGTTLIVCLPS